MTIEEIKRTFRSPDPADYPELEGYTRREIYEGKMGPGGLYLAAQMSRALNMQNGERLLDLGCGTGTTSIFLARHLGVTTFALDLWISATRLYQRIQAEGMEQRVIPLNLDVTQKLPFAEGYFDGIFCMDSIHYYGGEPGVPERLFQLLRPGGRLCIGSPCFTDEFSEEALKNLPSLYDDGSDLWPVEFSRYHSPGWWNDLINSHEGMNVIDCGEIANGEILWEDDILNNIENSIHLDTVENDADQIRLRAEGMPYLTHFILTAEKSA